MALWVLFRQILLKFRRFVFLFHIPKKRHESMFTSPPDLSYIVGQTNPFSLSLASSLG